VCGTCAVCVRVVCVVCVVCAALNTFARWSRSGDLRCGRRARGSSCPHTWVQGRTRSPLRPPPEKVTHSSVFFLEQPCRVSRVRSCVCHACRVSCARWVPSSLAQVTMVEVFQSPSSWNELMRTGHMTTAHAHARHVSQARQRNKHNTRRTHATRNTTHVGGGRTDGHRVGLGLRGYLPPALVLPVALVESSRVQAVEMIHGLHAPQCTRHTQHYLLPRLTRCHKNEFFGCR
jgi:hypothetical protein